jgi:hypothetical protein
MKTGGPTFQDLADALHTVAIGGNHLALIIGSDHPPYTAHDDVALRHYGDNLDTYNAWVCWKIIMTATREVYDQLPEDVRDVCWKRSQQRRAKAAAQDPRP